MTNFSLSHRRLTLALVLFYLLYLIYVLTMTGNWAASDELWIADTVESLALRGNMLLGETRYLAASRLVSPVEPIQPALAVPLYWLARSLPWAGNMHTLFLFNPIITALTAVLFFFYALDLGYSERTSIVGSLLFSLTTIAWPYTQTLFREPLTGLSLLAAAFLWEQWRRSIQAGISRSWPRFGLAIVATLLALFSKEATLILMPGFVLLAVPGRAALKANRWLVVAGGATFLAIILAVSAGPLLFEANGSSGSRYDLVRLIPRFFRGIPEAGYGLAGYLVSPGKGIWLFSPILLLALAAPRLLPRERWRETWLPLGLTLWFAFVYAAAKEDIWFGGSGWGARFMVPIIPVLMIAALPALDRMVNARSVWPKFGLALLAAAGIAVQTGGLYVNLYSYFNYYQQTTGQLPWLGDIIWNIRWSQPVGSLLFIPQAATDLLWLVNGVDWLAMSLISIGIVTCGLTLAWQHYRSGGASWIVVSSSAACLLLAVIVTGIGLSRAYPDPRYDYGEPGLAELHVFLQQQATADDVVMLSTSRYVENFLNYYKAKAQWYGLLDSPGEQSSPEQPPLIVSDQVEDLIAPRAVELFNSILQDSDRYRAGSIWLVVDSGPFIPWATRPPEWYLAKYAYIVGVTEFAPTARVVRYLPVRAPDANEEPSHLLDTRFGDSIRLAGFDIWQSAPDGESLRPGDKIGLSLLWEAADVPDENYTVAIHVINEAGQVVAQQDRAPQDGFAPTNGWDKGQLIRDNYGFILPDVPAGHYQLWATIYSWPSLERLPVTDAAGKSLGDHIVLTTIQIEP